VHDPPVFGARVFGVLDALMQATRLTDRPLRCAPAKPAMDRMA
jgi:hypothetical protein